MRNLAPKTLTVALLLLGLTACSTDIPTAPERTPAPPPGSSPTTSWNITVSAEPRNVVQNGTQPATITIRVRRADDGTPPPDGTTAVATATLGDFNSSGSGVQTVTVSLRGGVAQLLYFAGGLLGTDTIQVQLESSVGQALVGILEQAVLFIESVSPSGGPEGGGTRIRISGTAFSSPARVTVGGINATVDAVGRDSLGEFIRAFTGPVFDPNSFFGSEDCDTDGDGILDGKRFLAKTVEVLVTLTDGSATLANAFTYQPSNTSCRDITPDPDRPRARFSFIVNGLTVLFVNESTPGAGVTYTWVFGDGSATSSAKDPVHTYGAAGSFDVTLLVSNSSGSDSVTNTVTVP